MVKDGHYTLAGWLEVLFIATLFGLAGIAGAMMCWGIVRWLSPTNRNEWRRLAVVGATAAAVSIIAWFTSSLFVDRSCHNPLRGGGESIAAIAAFDLIIPERDWPAVDDELRRFARQRGWDVQVATQPATDFPWYQQSLCVEPGTQISVMNAASRTQLSVSAFQPQGGDSWQAPLHELQRRFEGKWPGSVRYRYDAYSAPRPPWAPPAPTPTPSAAAR